MEDCYFHQVRVLRPLFKMVNYSDESRRNLGSGTAGSSSETGLPDPLDLNIEIPETPEQPSNKSSEEWSYFRTLEQRLNETFTATFAFPTPSGPLHVGHGLGYTAVDVIVKFEEMCGREIFFPFGVHATGRDIYGILREIDIPNREHIWEEIRAVYRTRNEKIKGFRKKYRSITDNDLRLLRNACLYVVEHEDSLESVRQKIPQRKRNEFLQELQTLNGTSRAYLRDTHGVTDKEIDAIRTSAYAHMTSSEQFTNLRKKLGDGDIKTVHDEVIHIDRASFGEIKRRLGLTNLELDTLVKIHSDHLNDKEYSPIFARIREHQRKKYGLSARDIQKIIAPRTGIEIDGHRFTPEERRAERLIQHFLYQYLSGLKDDLSFSLDSETAFSTSEPSFYRFIKWSMRRLSEKNYIRTIERPRPYCGGCEEPKVIDKAQAEVVIRGADEAKIEEGTIIFFYDPRRGVYLPAYTKKPETVWGVTNVWFNSNLRYFEGTIRQRKLILTEEAIPRVEDYAGDSFRNRHRVDSEYLSNLRVQNPVSGGARSTEVPLFHAEFITDSTGTGIVMCVPAHDPHDYAYLAKIRPELARRARHVIVDSNGQPLRVEVDMARFAREGDAYLNALKEENYALQNRDGVMDERLRYIGTNFGNLSVPAAREKLSEALRDSRDGIYFAEMRGDARCRAHRGTRLTVTSSAEPCIDYSSPRWKKDTKDLVRNNLTTYPRGYINELLADGGIIDTRDARPAVRRYRGSIGTPANEHVEFRYEAIADSNIYMEWYAIVKLLRTGQLPTEALTDEFFDYVFTRKGSVNEVASTCPISEDMLNNARDYVQRVYPLDLNAFGREHKDVHGAFFLFWHAVHNLLPEDFFPREVLLTSHVTMEGEKMSKSKGNVKNLEAAVTEAIGLLKDARMDEIFAFEGNEKEQQLQRRKIAGDFIRFFYVYSRPLDQDFDWSDKQFTEVATTRVRGYIGNVRDVLTTIQKRGTFPTADAANAQLPGLDQWLVAQMHTYIRTATEHLRNRDLRNAYVTIADLMRTDLNTYMNKEGSNVQLVAEYLTAQLKMLYPVIPNVATRMYREVQAAYHQKTGRELQTHEKGLGYWPQIDREKEKVNAEVLAEVRYSTDAEKTSFVDEIKRVLRAQIPVAYGRLYAAARKTHPDLVDAPELNPPALEVIVLVPSIYEHSLLVANLSASNLPKPKGVSEVRVSYLVSKVDKPHLEIERLGIPEKLASERLRLPLLK